MANSPMPWIAGALSLGLVFGALHAHELQRRLGELEARPSADPATVDELSQTLSAQSTQLASARGELQRLMEADAHARRLERRLHEIEAELARAACELEERIDSQGGELAKFEALVPDAIDHRIDHHIGGMRRGLETRWRALDASARQAADLARDARAHLQTLENGLLRDEDRMWRDLLGPTVQLIGDETVGSGVLLQSEPVPDSEAWVTYLITAWHVVRDIRGADPTLEQAIPVSIYSAEGRVRPETAQLVRFDAALDVALLKLNSPRPVDSGAKLAPRETLRATKIFERIYAVGCPLGNDPIPTYGEIADTRHVVEGQTYWMISAPTYIGNSGGGIFDAQTHELLGIFTKIYTHGSLRPTVVPHMGLATPLASIYDWLDQVGFAGLEASATAKVASAPR